MKNIKSVDISQNSFKISRDLKVTISTPDMHEGPAEQFDGLNVGIVTLDQNPPHNGEVHLDGDEILYVISGELSLTSDSNPNETLSLGPSDSCIISKGEWHKVNVIKSTQLLYITPGLNNDHREL